MEARLRNTAIRVDKAQYRGRLISRPEMNYYPGLMYLYTSTGRYDEITRIYFRDCDGALFYFILTNPIDCCKQASSLRTTGCSPSSCTRYCAKNGRVFESAAQAYYAKCASSGKLIIHKDPILCYTQDVVLSYGVGVYTYIYYFRADGSLGHRFVLECPV